MVEKTMTLMISQVFITNILFQATWKIFKGAARQTTSFWETFNRSTRLSYPPKAGQDSNLRPM